MTITYYPNLLGSSTDHKTYVGEYTSKGRLEVSNAQTVFFNTFQYGIETDVWDTSTASGGTAVFDSSLSAIVMGVTSTLGSETIRQTLNCQRYIPSRQSELTFAIRLQTPVAGIRRRFGLFDGTDGLYFEDNGGDYACVLLYNGTANRVSRSSWNGDKLDGTGPSGLTADPTALQIVCMDYEWYGAGQVKFSFIIDGKKVLVHSFNTANRSTLPWCRTPFLPIRLELKNVTGAAGSHYMWQGSNSLLMEGNTEKLGIGQNLLSPVSGTTLTAANTFYPIISIRLKSTALGGIVLPTAFQAATLDNTSIFFKLVRNATLTGGTWVDMPDTNSFVQYNITSTASSSGTTLFSGFIPSNSGGTITELDPNTLYQIGRQSMGTISDTLTLEIAATVANKAGIGSLNWIEQR